MHEEIIVTYLGAMLKLKLQVIGPGVSKIWINLHRADKPLPRLGHLALCPEQSKQGFKKTVDKSDKKHLIHVTNKKPTHLLINTK